MENPILTSRGYTGRLIGDGNGDIEPASPLTTNLINDLTSLAIDDDSLDRIGGVDIVGTRACENDAREDEWQCAMSRGFEVVNL